MDGRFDAGVRTTPQLVLGLVVIVVGVLFILDNLSILQAREYLRFWPLGIMALGLSKFFDSCSSSGRIGGLVIFAAGALLLLSNLDLFRFRFHDFWPLILVFVGIAILWQALFRDRLYAVGDGETVSAIAVMSGVERTCNSQDFRGGDLTAIMGGCEIDLRPAAMQVDQAVINTFAFWGGIEIRVPEDWTVISRGLPFMGGFEERTRTPKDGAKRRLIIKGFAIMGGVEVRN